MITAFISTATTAELPSSARATGAMRPERKLDRAHTFKKTHRRLKKLFHRDDVNALLADHALER